MTPTKVIHHAIITHTDKYVVDPELGLVKRPVRALRASDIDRIVHPGFDTFERDSDGSFVVPVEVADFMLRMPGWSEGASPFAAEFDEADEKPRASRSRKPRAKHDA